jgi:NitT/TauT family transport system ATP-binding protein
MMIQLVGLSHTFTGRGGAVPALDSISLTVGAGEFVAVVGRSGCGKSTMLRIVAGLLPPTTGEVLVAGVRVHRPRPNVSLVFQRPALLPWRSVLDNVMLPAEIHRWPRREHRARAQELLELVGLAGFERRLPHELSGGMQQRVAVCRSLLTSPEVLLMDEPFSALDALTREELCAGLQDLHMRLRPTIMFVTHSIDEAVLLADRVVVLTERPGRVRTTIDVEVPRPRSLGRSEHSPVLAACAAQLHDLLRPATSMYARVPTAVDAHRPDDAHVDMHMAPDSQPIASDAVGRKP